MRKDSCQDYYVFKSSSTHAPHKFVHPPGLGFCPH